MMTTMTQNQDHQAQEAAQTLLKLFDSYHEKFQSVTALAQKHFENREWSEVQREASDRLDLFPEMVREALRIMQKLLTTRLKDRNLWIEIKKLYLLLIKNKPDPQLAETFFNSVARRLLNVVGFDQEIDILPSPLVATQNLENSSLIRRYLASKTQNLLTSILQDYSFETPYENLNRDISLAAKKIDSSLRNTEISGLEMLKPVFYRNKGAYIIGRAIVADRMIPLIIALLNQGSGITIDAVLLSEEEASLVFSFTRSYFRVACEKPRELITFLKQLMPLKPVSELYSSIGYHKHGKAELYADLRRHLLNSNDRFELTQGEKGLVMCVFTLPSYDVVFKVIRDEFGYTKNTTREKVMEKYQLVFKHDRAGRLVDAQDFQYLEFDISRFSEDLLRELKEETTKSVKIDENHVVIRLLYTERRVYPLDLYLKEEPIDKIRRAAIDYGYAIKDLAAANIFPGDLLLRNFGVTRHGRVVCYDYDEICLLTDLNVRKLPGGEETEDTSSEEPLFVVGENDFFPEEFKTFLGFPEEARKAFAEVHSDLFETYFWQETIDRVRNMNIADIYPYTQDRRLRAND